MVVSLTSVVFSLLVHVRIEDNFSPVYPVSKGAWSCPLTTNLPVSIRTSLFEYEKQ